jgi:PAS domain S-box-containing protein
MIIYALFVAACIIVLQGAGSMIGVIASADHLVIWGALVCLYSVALILAGPMSRGLWTGYVYFSVMAASLTTGLASALLVALGGGVVAITYKMRFSRHSRLREAPWSEVVLEFMGRVAISAAAVFAFFIVINTLGVRLPIRSLDDAGTLFTVGVASLLALGVMLAVGLFVLKADRRYLYHYVRKSLLFDILLQMTALVLPVIFFNVGVAPTLILLGLLTLQAFRYQQINRTRDLLDKRDREVSTLSNLGQAVSGNLSLGEVLAEIYDQLCQLVEPTHIISVLYDDKSEILEFPSVEALHIHQAPQRRKIGSDLPDWIVRHRQPLMFSITQVSPTALTGVELSQVRAQAFMGVPLTVGDKLIGVLAVSHDTDPDAFNAMDMTILQTVASHASLAIRNASLYNRSVRLANNLSIINQSLHQVMFNLDRDSLVRVAAFIASQVTEAERAAVFVVQERLGMRLVAEKGLEGVLPEGYIMPYRPELYRQGSRAIDNVATVDDAELKEMARLIGFQACLEVPLRSSNTLVGMIVVYHSHPHVHEFTDISLLEMLANQVTAAFDNTDLLQALELYASEQAQLVHLSRITTSNLDLERVILDVTQTIIQMVSIHDAEIAIFRTANVLDIYRVAGDETLERSEIHLHELPEASIVLENPQLANPYILYANDESISPQTRSYMQKRGFAMLALMPMSVSKQVFGILMLGSSEPVTFVDNTRRLLEMAIHQISAQIHNARIYTITEEALSQQLEQLSLIEDIAQKISQSLNQDTIISNVLDAALRAAQADVATLALRGKESWELITHYPDGHDEHIKMQRAEMPVILLQAIEQADIVTDSTLAQDHRTTYSQMAVPLTSGERVLGALSIVRHQDKPFEQEHANFIRSLAGHAAISIDNADLLDERQHQITALTSLRRLTLDVMGSLDEQEVTHAILQTTLRLMNASEASLYGYDSRTDEIVPISGMRFVDNAFHTVEPRVQPLPVYTALRERSMITHYSDLPADYDSQGNIIYPTLCIAPIQRHNTIREVLVFAYDTPREITERDRNTIDLLAVQIAGFLENVRLNQVIRNSNNRMRAILDSTRDGIILLDSAGRIQEANLRANQLLDVALGSAIGESFYRFVQQNLPEDSRALLELLNAAGSEAPEPREIVLQRDENVLYLQAMVLPVRDSEGNNLGRLLNLRDVTEEKQLARTRESLQRMVLHDLRSPMGAIITGLSFIQVLVDDIDPAIARDIRRTLDASLESAGNLMRLMDTLRDIPRMKDIVIEPQRTSIRALAAKAYESLETLFAEANIHFEMMIEQDAVVNVDVDLMRRVLINLLHNALKFTPEGGRIIISADYKVDKTDFIRLTVCDNGPGIPMHMRERIFNEFQQVEGQMPKRGGRGTGLGLTLCKLAVEAHGGNIWVENEGLLPGACFAFTLPLDTVATAEIAHEKKP